MSYWINSAGALYAGDMVPGDREATQEEIDAWFHPTEVEAQKEALRQQIAAIDTATVPLLNQAVIAQIVNGAPIPEDVATELQTLAAQKAALQTELDSL